MRQVHTSARCTHITTHHMGMHLGLIPCCLCSLHPGIEADCSANVTSVGSCISKSHSSLAQKKHLVLVPLWQGAPLRGQGSLVWPSLTPGEPWLRSAVLGSVSVTVPVSQDIHKDLPVMAASLQKSLHSTCTDTWFSMYRHMYNVHVHIHCMGLCEVHVDVHTCTSKRELWSCPSLPLGFTKDSAYSDITDYVHIHVLYVYIHLENHYIIKHKCLSHIYYIIHVHVTWYSVYYIIWHVIPWDHMTSND